MLFKDSQIQVSEKIIFPFDTPDDINWSLAKIRIEPHLITEYDMGDNILHEKLPTGQDKD